MSNYPFPTINDLAFVAYSGARVVFGGLYVTGQPSTDAIAAMATAPSNVKSVICVRSPNETKPVSPPYPPVPPFDPAREKADCERAGMTFTNEYVITRDMQQRDFDRIATAAALAMLRNSQGLRPALVHCSTGDRASSVFAVLLIIVTGVSNADVVDYGKNCLLLANDQIISLVQNYSPPQAMAEEARSFKGVTLGGS